MNALNKGKKFRIMVLLSGFGSNLGALIEKQQQYGYRIAAVVSNCADAYGIQRAAEHKIPYYVFDSKSSKEFEHLVHDLIEESACDLIVLAGFMRILTKEFVEHFTDKLINIHPSLLPQFKGLETHKRVLESGVLQHGSTVHFVMPELDAGPMIAQASFAIHASDNVVRLQHRVQRLEHLLYPLVVGWIATNRLERNAEKIWLDNRLLGPYGYHFTEENLLNL